MTNPLKNILEIFLPKEVVEIFERHNFTDYEIKQNSVDTYVVRTHVFDRRLFNELASFYKTMDIDIVWERRS